MKQLRIKLSAKNDKCRQKAMQVAVVAKGVTSVALEGESNNELVVGGDGIDAAYLVLTLRRKVCYATLDSLEEVMPEVDENPCTPHFCISTDQYPMVSYDQTQPEKYILVHDPYGPTTGCTIM